MLEAEGAPPYANRGVQRTDRSALRALVDWCEATLQIVHNEQQIFDILGIDFDQFTSGHSGKNGYKRAYRNKFIWVMFDHDKTPGYHIVLSGQGCRQFESESRVSWAEFFESVISLGGKFSRFDAAIDDISKGLDQKPYFTIRTLYRKVREGACVSFFKRGKKISDIDLATGEIAGESLYLGRGASDIQIRFYDKLEERKRLGIELEEGLTAWIRTELQCRRQRAHMMAVHYVMNPDQFLETVCGVLRNYVSFRVKNASDSNRRRWDVCKWWDEFLSDAERVKLSLKAPDLTIERAMRWMDKQVAPTLAMLFTAFDGDEKRIYEYIITGMDRLTGLQQKLAKDYSDFTAEERKRIGYERKNKFNEYLFRTGAHRIEKDTLGNVSEENN